MELSWAPFLNALFGGLIGGGTLLGAAYILLKSKLITDLSHIFVEKDKLVELLLSKEVFCKRSEVNALGSRVNGLVTVATEARTTADTNAAEVARLHQQGSHTLKQMETLLTRLEASHERMVARQEKTEGLVQRTVATLDALEKRIDRDQQRRG